MPLLFDLNVFSDSNAQPDTPGIYSIIETVVAGCSFLLGVTGSYAIIGSKLRIANSSTQFILGAFYTAFFVAQTILLFLRLNKRGILYEWGWNDGTNTCADFSFTGCPIARYEHANYTVETISDCQFNAFDLNNIDDGSGALITVDWSNVFNYDVANSAILATAANSGGTLEVDAAAMPNIGDCWYWGCNSVCHSRYKLNQMWTIYGTISMVVYIILSILSFVAAAKISKEEDLVGESADEESVPLKLVDESDEWSSNVSSSAVRSLNFSLRM